MIDGDASSRARLERVLQADGSEVICADSFEAASQHLTQERPDLLVSAARLGRFNGLHVALRGRADYPRLPVIILGDPLDEGLAVEATRLGARFLLKAIDDAGLLAVVADLLGASGAPRGTARLSIVATNDPDRRTQITADEVRRLIHDVQNQPPTAPRQGITATTFYRLKARFGWMPADEVRRLRQLEDENRKLKQIVVDQALDIERLKERK